jgi:release factor glutamine methyltransferase
MSKPFAYVVGYVDFYDLHLEVTPDVLIPRCETEILADKVVQRVKEKGWDSFTVVDLCTGSGCLGLAIKSVFPKARVILIDICEKALAVAKRNAEKHQLEVEICLGDALENYAGPPIDLFLSNPPYVTAGEYETLDASVKDFEPKKALVAGESGFEIYQKISNKLFPWMEEGGLAAFEIGWQQREGFERIYSLSNWKSIKCEKDWSGHDRFFFLEK